MTKQINKTLKTQLKTVATAVTIVGVIGGISMPVAAKKYRNYQESRHSTYDFAKVVDVQPIVESFKVNNPIEQCWDERVPTNRHYRKSGYYEQGYRRGGRANSSHSKTGELLGAIIGGAIGNQFGNGRGKKIATAAGAVLGASVAHDVKHNNRKRNDRERYRGGRYDRNAYRIEQRCELRDNYTIEEQIIAYKVAYKYRGNVFHTEMNRDPGNKIKVKVTVDPV